MMHPSRTTKSTSLLTSTWRSLFSRSKASTDADDPWTKYSKRRRYYFNTKLAAGVTAVAVSILMLLFLSNRNTHPTPPVRTTQGRQLAELERMYFSNAREHSLIFVRTLQLMDALLNVFERNIVQNLPQGIRWTPDALLPPLYNAGDDYEFHQNLLEIHRIAKTPAANTGSYFAAQHRSNLAWQDHWNHMQQQGNVPPLAVDYTDPTKYRYPRVQLEPPRSYPPLRPLREIMEQWPQHEDYEGTISETLLHFNYSNPVEREAAVRFRNLELPFKLVDIPEITEAGIKWTDDYLSQQLDQPHNTRLYNGMVQESPDDLFVFFSAWDVQTLGLPPVRFSDMSYATWVEHAKYADAVRLPNTHAHFYYQATDFVHTRYTDEKSFMSNDLPSFGSPNNTYFVFDDGQSGIQCRMGERGVVVANHYDNDRNYVAMVTGAKRYILSPPRECDKLAMFAQPLSPLYRHSHLNYDHFRYMDHPGMSQKERAWLQRAATSGAVETVLKAGEALYIPSYWFHYIVGLQKSTQCNCRSGEPTYVSPTFGGKEDVRVCGQDYGLLPPGVSIPRPDPEKLLEKRRERL